MRVLLLLCFLGAVSAQFNAYYKGKKVRKCCVNIMIEIRNLGQSSLCVFVCLCVCVCVFVCVFVLVCEIVFVCVCVWGGVLVCMTIPVYE